MNYSEIFHVVPRPVFTQNPINYVLTEPINHVFVNLSVLVFSLPDADYEINMSTFLIEGMDGFPLPKLDLKIIKCLLHLTSRMGNPVLM